MTRYDAHFRSALALLAAGVDETPAWDDVVDRAETRPSFPWRAAALAVAVVATSAVVAGALAQGFFSDSFDRLSSWAGEQPGAPDPGQQAAFDRENALAYARFPSGTRIGRLLHTRVGDRPYTLFGFRAGQQLCLRLVPVPFPRNPAIPDCVPRSELARLGEPIAPIGGHVRSRLADGSGLTMLYGLVSDSVESVEVLEDGRPLGFAKVGNNAFLYAVRDEPGSAVRGPALRLRARDGAGNIRDVPFATGPLIRRVDTATLPGPDRVERRLSSGVIGWLERNEPRGEPYDWATDGFPGIVWSRYIQPDPASAFRTAIARGNGYCLAWLWPLVADSFNSFCSSRDVVASGLMYLGAWQTSGAQFPLWIGLASDEIARIELFRPDGTSDKVALRDNVLTFQTWTREKVKLVAYDHEGRVVTVEVVGAAGGSLRAIVGRR
jgi:hypothetical protein